MIVMVFPSADSSPLYSSSVTYYVLNGDSYDEVDGVTADNFSDYYLITANSSEFDSNKTYYTLNENTLTKENITEFAADVTYYTVSRASSYNSSKDYYKTTDDGQTYVLDEDVNADTFSIYYIYSEKKVFVVDFANPEGNAKFIDCETSEQGSSYSKLASDILNYLTENYLNS